MINLEYRSQSKAIDGKLSGAVATYLSLIGLFLTTLFLISLSNDIDSKIIAVDWAATAVVVSLTLVCFDHQGKNRRHLEGIGHKETRKFLSIDFFINYGLQQLIYSIGPSLTQSSEMIKFRLLMFLSIPTNIVMQILSTSGLRFLFEDPKYRKQKLFIFNFIAIAPLILITSVFAGLGTRNLQIHFGEIWSEIPSLLPYFLVMSLSALVLSHTAMIVKWNGLTKSLLYQRILVSTLQIPLTLFSIVRGGAFGILLALILSNTIFTFLNLSAIRKK